MSQTIAYVKGLSKSFTQRDAAGREKKLPVLVDVSFEVEKGSFTSILGPSGCGKSTLLNMFSRLERLDSGTIEFDPKDTTTAYVFQSPRLMPWANVIKNVRFAQDSRLPKEKREELAWEYLKMVGLEEWAHVYPHQLSGGMQQRVGIARALSVEPDLLLMDEPFSHLDEITAKKLRADLVRILLQTSSTVLFVTHDMSEAVYLSDRIILLTRKPARVFKDVKINLPRPRSYEDRSYFEFYLSLTKEFEVMEQQEEIAAEPQPTDLEAELVFKGKAPDIA